MHFPDFAKKCPILVKICHFRLRVHRHTGAAEVHNSTWKDCLAPKLCTQASHGPQQSLQLPVKVLKHGTPKKGSFWLCAKCVSLNVDMWDLKMLPKYSSCSKENFDYFQIFKSFLIPHQRFYGFARTPTLKDVNTNVIKCKRCLPCPRVVFSRKTNSEWTKGCCFFCSESRFLEISA